jgi:hypothetical protein
LGLAFLALVPTVVLWALPHTLTLHGDNLIQNFPLRVLVGALLRRGQGPFWDPAIWSGTPLLAGFNAGAAYPLSWLFAVLPPLWAWVVTLSFTYALAGCGFYLFMRALGRTPWASGLAAVTFAWAGFMSAQMVHLETVEGVAWTPWIAAEIVWMGKEPSPFRRWLGMAGLGVSGGLVMLAASPEAMAYGAILAAVIAIAAVIQGQQRGSLVVALWGAALLALAVGAIQWLPGDAFIRLSQRAHASFRFFGSMSWPPVGLLLMVFPYILGGYRRFLVPMAYHGPFNLPEISGYVGLLPLLAWLGWWVKPKARSDRVWVWTFLGLAVLGAVFALGRYTPVDRLLYLVPLYHDIRAQNRNLFLVDYGLSAAFGIWVDAECAKPRRRLHWQRWALFGGDVAATLALLGWGTQVAGAATAPHMPTYLGYSAALVVAAGAVFFLGSALPPRLRAWALATVVLVDVGVYNANQYWLNAPGATLATGGSPLAQKLAQAARGGRFVLIDPNLVDYPEMEQLGEPDLNILDQVWSASGYGSLVAARYQKVTGAHRQGNFLATALSPAVMRQLNVSALVTVPAQFVSPSPPVSPVPLPTRPRPAYFGRTLEVSAVTVALSAPPPPGRWQIGGLQARSTRVQWLTATMTSEHSRLTWTFRKPVALAGLVFQPPRPGFGGLVKSLSVSTPTGVAFVSGPLQQALAWPQWSYQGQVGDFAVFDNHDRSGWFWLGSPGTGRIDSAEQGIGGRAVVRVHADRAGWLYRSEAYQPGWQASIAKAGGGSAVVPVRADGLIQRVWVPAGRDTVTFWYQPPLFSWACALSAAGGAGVAASVLAAFRSRRRVESPPTPV